MVNKAVARELVALATKLANPKDIGKLLDGLLAIMNEDGYEEQHRASKLLIQLRNQLKKDGYNISIPKEPKKPSVPWTNVKNFSAADLEALLKIHAKAPIVEIKRYSASGDKSQVGRIINLWFGQTNKQTAKQICTILGLTPPPDTKAEHGVVTSPRMMIPGTRLKIVGASGSFDNTGWNLYLK